MTAHARARPVGRWLTGTTLDEPELELWDSNLEKTINGALGGLWSPTARIVVGGAGMRIGGDFDAQDVRSLIMTAGARVTFASPGVLVERYLDLSDAVARPFPGPDGDPGWIRGVSGTVRPHWLSFNFGAPITKWFPMLEDCTLLGIKVTLGALTAARVDENGNDLGPAEPSTIEIVRSPRNAATPTLEVLGVTSDVFTTTAAYEAPHDIPLVLDETHIVDPTYRYGMRLYSENGRHAGSFPDAFTNQQFIALQVSVMAHGLDPYVK